MELIMPGEAASDFSPFHDAPEHQKWQKFLHDSAIHTAPSSPIDKSVCFNSDSEEFEFETSRRFADFIELEIGQDFECFVEDLTQHQEQGMKVKRERGGSLPSMAFADELFHNGLVMPLKPPPRLHYCENASFSQGSAPPSPRSPRTASVFKVPYVHKAAWNDDFDPFKAALERVSGEGMRRTSDAERHHRRARSHSPLRTNNSMDKSPDQPILGSKFAVFLREPKGSPYARFVIDQKKQAEQNATKMHHKFSFGKRVRPLKLEESEGNRHSLVSETGIKRIGSMLLKYASFGKDRSNNDKAMNWKSSFKKLSFKIKGHGSGSEKKRGVDHEDSKMEVVEFKRNKPSLALCFYGIERPKNVHRKPI